MVGYEHILENLFHLLSVAVYKHVSIMLWQGTQILFLNHVGFLSLFRTLYEDWLTLFVCSGSVEKTVFAGSVNPCLYCAS